MITTKSIKHTTCPRCGDDEVFNDYSVGQSDIDSTIYASMYCEGCKNTYDAVYAFSHTVHAKD